MLTEDTIFWSLSFFLATVVAFLVFSHILT